MAALDWIILFLTALIGIVLLVLKNKKDDTSDYFLSGRSETWLTFGTAFVPLYAHNIVFTKPDFIKILH